MPAGSHENSWAGGIAFIRSCLFFLSSCLHYQSLHILASLSLLPFDIFFFPLLFYTCSSFICKLFHFLCVPPSLLLALDESGWALKVHLILRPSFHTWTDRGHVDEVVCPKSQNKVQERTEGSRISHFFQTRNTGGPSATGRVRDTDLP